MLIIDKLKQSINLLEPLGGDRGGPDRLLVRVALRQAAFGGGHQGGSGGPVHQGAPPGQYEVAVVAAAAAAVVNVFAIVFFLGAVVVVLCDVDVALVAIGFVVVGDDFVSPDCRCFSCCSLQSKLLLSLLPKILQLLRCFKAFSVFFPHFRPVGELPPLLRASGPPLPIPSRDTARHIQGPESKPRSGKSISRKRVKNANLICFLRTKRSGWRRSGRTWRGGTSSSKSHIRQHCTTEKSGIINQHRICFLTFFKKMIN